MEKSSNMSDEKKKHRHLTHNSERIEQYKALQNVFLRVHNETRASMPAYLR